MSAYTSPLYDKQAATPRKLTEPHEVHGRVRVFRAYTASVAGGGGAGDTMDFGYLPKDARVLGGYLDCESGLMAGSQSFKIGFFTTAGVAIDDDCILAATAIDAGGRFQVPGANIAAARAAAVFPTPSEVLVRGTTATGGLVTAKDFELVLFYVTD